MAHNINLENERQQGPSSWQLSLLRSACPASHPETVRAWELWVGRGVRQIDYAPVATIEREEDELFAGQEMRKTHEL